MLMKNSVLVWFFFLFTVPALTNAAQFTLSSESFTNDSKIPLKHARNGMSGGKNISPQLNWKNPPEGTKSFALICVDTASIANNWIHWAVFNIPANVRSINEGVSCKNIPPECIENPNSFEDKGYSGPQPPKGTGVHTYVFTICALNVDNITTERKFYNYDQFLKLLNGKILEKASISGTFINE